MTYFQVQIADNSKNSNSFYILAFGKAFDPATGKNADDQSYVSFDASGNGTLVTPTASTMASQYTKELTTFPKNQDGTAYVMNLPACTGRVYLSMGQPLCLTVNLGPPITISDPNGFDPLDPNYPVIYDKFELNYVPGSGVWIDTTAVDFFGLPLTLTMPVNGVTQTAGLTGSRATWLTALEGALTGDWKVLVLRWTDGTVLRVMAPNEAQSFPSDYLDDYINAIWTFYQTNQLAIDCRQLNDVAGLNITAENSLFTGGIDANGNFTFTNAAPTTTVSLTKPTSNDVFGCNGPAPTDSWTPQNSTAQGVIVTALDAAMNVGILPLPPTTPAPALMSPFKTDELPPYWANSKQLPPDMQSTGPWYNLYAATLHSTGNAIYAFAFDDEAGQSSTLSSGDTTVVATIGINDLSDLTTLPVLTNDTLYDVTFFPGKGAQGLVNGTPLPGQAATEIKNLPSSFTLSYQIGTDGPWQDYTVNLIAGSTCPMLGGFLPSGMGTTTMTIVLPGQPQPPSSS